jgi:predicted house-cleaning noncanonical NTP pyrophosphatase (MazG superfamily)
MSIHAECRDNLLFMKFNHSNLEIENQYPKLVRDKIPEIINKNEGLNIESRNLNKDEEFLFYLKKKLSEEVAELNVAVGEGVEEEIADIFELIDEIVKLRGKTKKDIILVKNEKRKQNGGFKKRILMIGKK